MSGSSTGKARFELHVQPTGKGRRMNAVRPDGSVFASARTFGQLRQQVRRMVAELHGPGVEVALMVGGAGIMPPSGTASLPRSLPLPDAKA
jgi:hypothetical protein